ncbi:hypothetical protein EVAR_48471_1 [Eumeta japonica]|uniref:Uncharacterized protein n=1 Tax=Eumeta variegata TaxID=151549 RepID=A0A4C1XFU8_EUMVA|nr:hypothetical protein EVAR_48471_1 [Eumeta japonica]
MINDLLSLMKNFECSYYPKRVKEQIQEPDTSSIRERARDLEIAEGAHRDEQPAYILSSSTLVAPARGRSRRARRGRELRQRPGGGPARTELAVVMTFKGSALRPRTFRVSTRESVFHVRIEDHINVSSKRPCEVWSPVAKSVGLGLQGVGFDPGRGPLGR